MSGCLTDGNFKFFRSNCSGPNAIKVARVLENYSKGELSEEKLNEMFSMRSVHIIKILAEHIAGKRKVCVFGLGKLFNDNYYQSLWHNVIRADIFSDNSKEKWG